MAIVKYGREFLPISGKEWGLLNIELMAFREGWTITSGALGRTEHFIRICRELWPAFEWHEWALEMAAALCEYDVSGFTSGASSGKSEIIAKFGLVSWFADPVRTLVIACSTTAVDARQKVWGHIVRNFREARASNKATGHLIESQSIIRLSERTDGMAASDNASVCLVAAGDAFKDDSLKRLQGRHQRHVVLLLDELQDCSQEIVTTALGNLSANEKFEVHAAGNAGSRTDAHGTFMSPVDGWGRVNRTTHTWKIKAGGKIGIGVHFDCTSETSPNMKRAAAGQEQLKYLRKAEEVLIWKDSYGENNPTFLRQFVGFWPDSEGESNFIITEQELVVHSAYDSLGHGFAWQSAPTLFAGIDPSYTAGGDRFIFFPLAWGLSTTGTWTLYFMEPINVKVKPIKGETKDYAAIRQCKEIANDLLITTLNIGLDSSAANPILSIAHREWSPYITGVQFGGAPSDKPLSNFDKRLGKDLFANRTSELNYVLHEFLINGQVRGVTADHAKEMTNRQYELVAGGKIKVESKKDMKARLGYSCDLLDGGNIGLDVLRERLKILAGQSGGASGPRQDWSALQRKLDVTGRSEEARRKAFLGR